MSALELEIKNLIIDSLGLEDIHVDDIQSEAPLFGDGLGLDSVDALELGLALNKRYGVKIQSDAKETKAHFASVKSLAAFVQGQRP
jgi:acyl carrier protein